MYEKEMGLAIHAAKSAGEFLKTQTGTLQVDDQTGRDIKLAADRQSEEIILEALRPSGLPILSEESGAVGSSCGGCRWIVDPLDGTANYWKGMPELSCVSVALWDGDEPLLGVVYRFWQEELFSGIAGQGAWMNGAPISSSDTGMISQAILATGFPLHMPYDVASISAMSADFRLFKKVRMLGAAAIMGSFVASGRVDVYMEDHIMFWDIAAATAIVKGAGGVADIRFLEGQQCVCRLFANQRLQEEYMQRKGSVD